MNQQLDVRRNRSFVLLSVFFLLGAISFGVAGENETNPAGHNAPLRAIAYSPDGEMLATAGETGIVKLWDVLSGELKQNLTGHQFYVDDLAFSPDGISVSVSERR
ncbi:MAG: WD40 repeat domain-containing protein [Candidatus Brocadiia bacterium]